MLQFIAHCTYFSVVLIFVFSMATNKYRYFSVDSILARIPFYLILFSRLLLTNVSGIFIESQSDTRGITFGATILAFELGSKWNSS